MTAFLRKREKVATVRAAKLLLRELNAEHLRRPLEDTFGADDADWAIYRKIVRSIYIVVYH